MSKAWPTVPLGDVLRHRKEFFEIDDTAEYKRCRVQLHAKGIVLRDVVFGADIKTKQQRESRAGEFLVAEIDAKVGGFGIVPTELDGAIVSSHYFLFPIDEQKLERRFLEFFVRTPAFREQVSAQGSTNYAAIRPSHVLGYAIPLPPLAEQRRIVAKIEQLASKIEEARGLRRASVAEAGALERAGLGNVYHQLQETAGLSRLETVCEVITDGDHLTPPFQDEGVAFIFVGNVSTGRLHFDGCKHVTQDYFASLQANRKPRRGDILYSAVGATLGVPVVVDTDRQFCVQRHIAIIKPNHERAASEFLRHMLRSATVFNLAWKWTTGSAQPTISLRGIRALPVPIPPSPNNAASSPTSTTCGPRSISSRPYRPKRQPNSTPCCRRFWTRRFGGSCKRAGGHGTTVKRDVLDRLDGPIQEGNRPKDRTARWTRGPNPRKAGCSWVQSVCVYR